MKSTPPIDRRAFLSALGVLVVTACTGGPAPRRSLPTTAKDAAIFDLSFTEQLRFRPLQVVARDFIQTRADQPGTVTDQTLSDATPPSPFAAVEIDVRSAEGVLVAGLGSASGDHLLATYDPPRRRVTISLRRNGRTRQLRRRTVDLPASFTFGFALCENQVTVLVRTDHEWRPLLTERAKVAALIDLRRPDVLADFRYVWGVRPGTGQADLEAVRAGLFGMTGLRDPHLVQHTDGRPFTRDGKVFLTFTCAGLGFFQQAHWGVFSMDLDDPRQLEQVAQLYTLRDGLLLGDHAGQLVRDDERGRWLVATSSWGDFDFAGVHVRHTETSADLLSGIHVLETERTAMPTEVSSWDPGMVLVDGRWRVGFVESPSQRPFDFRPALAEGPDGATSWHEGLRLVGAATDLHQCEGPVLVDVGGDWWLLASDKDNQNYPVFTLAMRRVGRLDAPYLTNIPHPQLVPLPEGGYLMVTFDDAQFAPAVMGYGGHGDVVVMRSAG